MCKSRLTTTLMIITLVFCCQMSAQAGQNSAATVHIDLDTAVGGIQTTRDPAVDDVFDVDIVVNGAVNLTIFNLVVSFPETILEIQDVIQGDFFTAYPLFLSDLDTPGKAEVTGGVLLNDDAASGNGVLFRLRFRALSAEEAQLQFLAGDTQTLRDNTGANAGAVDDPVALGNANGGTVNLGIGVISAVQSTVEATTPVIANGTSTTTITLTAKDAFGNPIQGIAPADIVVSSTGSGNAITQPTAATDDSGQTTATMSSTVHEAKTVSATIRGTAITDTASVVFTPRPVSAGQSTVEATTPVVANGTSTTTITITAKDASGTPIEGILPGNFVVSSTGTGNTPIIQPTAPTDASGQTTAQMGSTVAETKTVSVTISGIAITDTAAVVFEPGPVSDDQSTVEATTPVAASVGPSGPQSTITITARDAQGNVLPDIAAGDVVVSSTGTGNTITQPTAATNASGQTTATMRSTVVETKTVSVTIGGTAITDTASVVFTGEPALMIEKSDDADPVDPNTEVTYTITYGNAGLADAHNTVIVETLPADLSYVSSTGGGVYDDAARTITWTIGTQNAADVDDTVAFTARVGNSGAILDGGPITNSELTIDCDETGPVGQITAETTTVNDKKAPETSGHVPDPNSFQIPIDTVIQLHITDGGSGVEYDGGTVTIQVEGDLIYDGANETSEGEYDSTGSSQTVKGVCTRSGTDADYTFVFQSSTPFDYEQKVDVVVNATDKAGNVMPEESYYFYTVMRSFGPNAKVNSDTGTLDQDNPATVADSGGNIWIVWDQTNAAGNTDIYVGILPADANAFEASVPVANTADNERKPAIAVDANDVVYVAWEADDPNGHWDVFVSSSTNGISWSAPVKVDLDDPNNTSDQMLPAIAIDRAMPNTLYVACQDNRAGNYDIWVASSTDGATWTPAQITTDANDQMSPTMTIAELDGFPDEALLAWTDAGNGAGADIYGAWSDDGWATISPIVQGQGAQSQLSIAIPGVNSGIHGLWIGDANGYADVFYGFVSDDDDLPFAGTSIIDEPNTVQDSSAMAAYYNGVKTKVFACWQDGRWTSYGDAADIYFAETASSFGTNILVNDDAAGNTQTKPDIGIDKNGNPYIVWVDDRNGNNDIYYAGATAINVLETILDDDGNEITIQVPSVGNMQITIPAGALPDRVDANNITIAEVVNPPAPPVGGFGLNYDFGPSGLQFSQPVTITIPHAAADCPGYSTWRVYWYTGTGWSQEGITNVQHDETSDPHTVSFQTTHFTTFIGGGSTVPGGGGSYHGGSGGCSISPNRQGDIGGFFLPYIAYVIVLFVTGWMHARKRRAKSSS